MENFPDSDMILPSSKANGRWQWYEVTEYHDRHINTDLNEIARLSGWCIRDIQRLLLDVKDSKKREKNELEFLDELCEDGLMP